MFKFIPLLFAALFFGAIRADKPIDCRDVLAKPGSAQLCQITWKKLQKNIYPTQAEVGYAWVASKLKGWKSVKDAQQNMDEKPTPVVIGREPGGNDLAFYLVDDHHTLSALDYADFKDDVVVTVKVLCDLSHLDPQSFWEYLSNHGFAYLAKSIHHNLPEPIPYTMMPTEFRFQKNSKAFADSAWRSLVSFSRKLKDNNRCMWRSCTPQGGSVFFFEFRWGYFLQDVTFPPPDPSNSYWPDAQSRNEFATLLDKVVAEPIDNLKKDVDLKEWAELASKIFPLCRAEKINNYLLPAWFDGSSGTRSHLPGIWTKNDPVPKDPKCHGSTCVAPALQASKTHTEF